MRQIVYAVAFASATATSALASWLYFFTVYWASEFGVGAAFLTLVFPVVAQLYWIATAFFEYGFRHILVFGFVLFIGMLIFTTVIFPFGRAPQSRWGMALMVIYVAGYWLRQAVFGVTTWSSLGNAEWWMNFGMNMIWGLFWPAIIPAGFVVGFLNVAMR